MIKNASSNEFEESLKKTCDFMLKYRSQLPHLPVASSVSPNQILNQLPVSPPSSGESFDRILQDLESLIIPGLTHWQHPQFMGYFPSNSSDPSLLAEMLIATFGVQAMGWGTSPAATELEIRVLEWLRDALGLPKSFSGVIHDSASNSTLAAMVAAREKATQFSSNEEGMENHRLVAYASEEAHSSVEKAAKIIGIGRRYFRKIPTNSKQEIDLTILASTLEADVKNGLIPFFITGVFGTTGSTAIDNLAELAKISEKYKCWFHIDAAYAGAALLLPEMRDLARGVELCDSFVFNPHKWLLTHFDCSTFYVKDREQLINSFSILPEYLKTSDANTVVNFRDWGLGLGRRFRALKLWFVFRWYGLSGLQNHIRTHLSLGALLEELVRADPRFEVVAERKFNLVCFRLKNSDEENLALLQRINRSGRLFITHCRLNGKIALRIVPGSPLLEEKHVREAWQVIAALSQ